MADATSCGKIFHARLPKGHGFATSFHLEAVSGTAQVVHLDFRPGGEKRDETSFGQRCPKDPQVAG